MAVSKRNIDQLIIRLMKEIRSFIKERGNSDEAIIALERVLKLLKTGDNDNGQ
jgi:hypothetical protein